MNVLTNNYDIPTEKIKYNINNLFFDTAQTN